MDELLELRRIHGQVFVSKLPTGQNIPWRPLSIHEYIEYDKLLTLGEYPRAFIEDEIFRKCVLSEVLVENLEVLRAGLVQSVVRDIFAYSGPHTIHELEYFLNINRQQAGQVIHQLMSVICQAFPAYKPEDVYAMDYSTFMLRAAQAEEKLLRTGLITEPLTFTAPGEEAPVQKAEPAPPPPPKNAEEVQERKKENLREQWRIQQAQEIKEHALPPPPDTTEQVIIKKADIIEHQGAMSGHDQDVVHHKNAADETAAIYGDYLEQLKSGGELKIKTPEERMEAAKQREKETKQQLLEQKNKIVKDMAEERKKLLEIREKERERRRRRAGRKR
jgi:hypothetical protein